MSFFKQVEGEAAILVNSGVYTQADLYLRDGYIYAKCGGGFVRLMADGSTTKARLRLDYMSWSGQLGRDGLGRLCQLDVVRDAKSLTGEAAAKLIGAPAAQ